VQQLLAREPTAVTQHQLELGVKDFRHRRPIVGFDGRLVTGVDLCNLLCVALVAQSLRRQGLVQHGNSEKQDGEAREDGDWRTVEGKHQAALATVV
jgi:hypothetical protein